MGHRINSLARAAGRALLSIGQASGAAVPAQDPENVSESDTDATRALSEAFFDALPEARSVAGGRVSFDRPEDMMTSAVNFIQPYSSNRYWQDFNVDTKSLSKVPVHRLVELLADISPEVSRALWDGILMCNPGWEISAIRQSTEDSPDKRAQAYVNEMVSKLNEYYVSPDIIFNRLFMSAFLRGSVASECVLDDAAREFIDIAVVDPKTLVHRRIRDEQRGVVFVVGQQQQGQFVRLDIPQFAYVPIHPFMSENSGRAPIAPALFTCVFLLAILRDLRRVVQQQGYPRVDISISFAKLQQTMPKDATGDPKKFKAWVDDVVNSVKHAIKGLKPDDTYVHGDAITVNQPVGALNANSLGMIDALFKALERMATRALKTMPLLMATTDGVSEANANRQWEIYAAGIKSLQHVVESVLEKHFNLALRAKGFSAHCKVRFAELRAAELLRDAQVELLHTTIARAKYDSGWTTQDEAAKEGANKDAAAEAQPRTVALNASISPTGAANAAANAQPEPGGNRGAMQVVRDLAHRFLYGTLERQAPTTAQVDSSVNIWREFAPDIAADLPAAVVDESEQTQ